MKPVGNHALGVHEIANCLKNSFEVVLLRLTTQNDVERLVDILQHAHFSSNTCTNSFN